MTRQQVRNLVSHYVCEAKPRLEGPVVRSAHYLRSLGTRFPPPVLPSIGLGVSRSGGEHVLAVRIQHPHFQEGEALRELEKLSGGEIDIRSIGSVHATTAPAQLDSTQAKAFGIGCSISHERALAGSLGTVMTYSKTGQRVIVSNNHVIGDSNQGRPLDSILTPGNPWQGQQTCAQMLGFLGVWLNGNAFDCAIATLSDGFDVVPGEVIPGLNLSGRSAEPNIGDIVYKPASWVSSWTQGIVQSILYEVTVTYDQPFRAKVDDQGTTQMSQNIGFTGQIEIQGANNTTFSSGGESGSIVVNSSGDVVGILFGAERSTNMSYANHFSALCSQLGLAF